ncbi:MAG: phage holin family protein [Myxococcota bacterium]|nr:phage holin family protein [Myxococcota bacterium]
MAGFVVRMALNILGLWVADNLVAGIEIRDAWSFVMAGFVLGAVNALVRPILLILTFPFTIVTLGFFVLVVNAGMLGLAAALVGGFYVSGFWAAFFGSLVVSLTSWGASFLIGPGGSFEYLEMNER